MSLLANWYFCRCVGAAPETTATYLAVQQAIHEADDEAARAAFDELARASVLHQIHALRSVLTVLRARPQRWPWARPYLEGLRWLILGDEDAPYRSVLAAISPDRPDDLPARLESAARTVLTARRETTREPYQDVRAFFPEALVIAVLLDALAEGEEVAETQTETLRLVDEACLGKRGRLAFVLGVCARARQTEGTAGPLHQTLWSLGNSDPLFEPDLLDALAESLYPPELADAGRLLTESRTFDDLSALVRARPKAVNNTAGAHARELVGCTDQDPHGALPAVYWGTILWDRACSADPALAASTLDSLWLAPTSKAVALQVGKPGPNAGWKELLESLLTLRGGATSLMVSKTQALELNEAARAQLFSPWASSDRHGRSGPSWIRLMACMPLAARLLQGPDEGKVRVRLSTMLVHGSSQISRWTEDCQSAGRRRPTTAEAGLRGLARFALAATKRVGSGRSGVSPQIFVDLLDVKSESPALLEDLGGELMGWIGVALGQGKASRWTQDQMSVVRSRVQDYDLGERYWLNRVLPLALTDPKLRRRTLRSARDLSQPHEPTVRRVLIAPYTSLEKEPRGRRFADVLLALRVEEALARPSQPLSALTERLSAFDPTGIDPCLVWRLVELLSPSALATQRCADGLAETIVRLVAEVGGARALDELDARVFGDDEDEPSRQQRELQRAAWVALEAAWEQPPARVGRAHDPYEVIAALERRARVEERLLQLALWVGPEKEGPLADLRDLMHDTRRKRLTVSSGNSRVVNARLDEIGTPNSPRELLRTGAPINSGDLTAAVLDRNRGQATLLLSEVDPEGATALLGANTETREAFLAQLSARETKRDRSLLLLARVESVSGGRPIYACGLDQPLKGLAKWPLAPGDWVSLRVHSGQGKVWVSNHPPHRLHRPRLRPGQARLVAVRETQRQQRWSLSLTARNAPESKLRTDKSSLEADSSRTFRSGPLARWELPGLLDMNNEEEQVSLVAARCDDRDRWVPEALSLLDLILELTHYEKTDWALFALADASDGRLEFVLRPGLHFAVQIDDFSVDDGQRLQECFEETDDPRGLLIGLRAAEPDQDHYLELVAESAEAESTANRARYPELTLPFDDRNVRWRELLSARGQEAGEG
ncbi:hypothetical protein OAX78_01545, partial [Planctomycetota bacterium]|nr:hypothetical protein [Planctomycetota bacterium]